MVYTNRKGMSDEELKAHERQLSSKSSSKHDHGVIKPSTEKMEKRRIQNAASHQRREERFNKTIETLASVGKDNGETILKGGNSTKKAIVDFATAAGVSEEQEDGEIVDPESVAQLKDNKKHNTDDEDEDQVASPPPLSQRRTGNGKYNSKRHRDEYEEDDNNDGQLVVSPRRLGLRNDNHQSKRRRDEYGEDNHGRLVASPPRRSPRNSSSGGSRGRPPPASLQSRRRQDRPSVPYPLSKVVGRYDQQNPPQHPTLFNSETHNLYETLVKGAKEIALHLQSYYQAVNPTGVYGYERFSKLKLADMLRHFRYEMSSERLWQMLDYHRWVTNQLRHDYDSDWWIIDMYPDITHNYNEAITQLHDDIQSIVDRW